jgi:DNA polymerase-3 subunit gamma/tau
VYEHGAPLAVTRAEVRIGYQAGSFLAQQAGAADALEELRAAVRSHFGPDTAVELDHSGRHGEVQTLAAKHSADHAARLEAARRRVAEHPLVTTAIDVLGAELREVRLPGEVG